MRPLGSGINLTLNRRGLLLLISVGFGSHLAIDLNHNRLSVGNFFNEIAEGFAFPSHSGVPSAEGPWCSAHPYIALAACTIES